MPHIIHNKKLHGHSEEGCCVAKGNNTNGKANSSNGANLGFEAQLWAAADKMRSHTDPAEYKHVVLGLIFLK
jgi:hypothetical protein